MTKNKKMNTKELEQVTGGIDIFSAARHLASSDQLASGLAVGSLAGGSLGGALDSTLAGGLGAPGNKLPGYSPASGKGTLA